MITVALLVHYIVEKFVMFNDDYTELNYCFKEELSKS